MTGLGRGVFGGVCLGVIMVFLVISNGWAFGSKKTSLSAEPTSASAALVKDDAVWVKRSDGALSCAPDKAQSLESGEEELKKADIRVFEARKGSDGKMHVQMCGALTGSENAYLISRADLPKALALGFYEVKESIGLLRN